jgi:NADH-quinone oxidoreductase subunit M
VAQLQDVNRREYWLLATMAAAVIWMGVYPKPFTDVTQASVDALLKHVAQSKVVPDVKLQPKPAASGAAQ